MELPPEFRQVDGYIAESEAFHRHTVPSRVRVILCRDWGAVRRYLPWLGGARVGGVTLATGTVIYITPIVEEKHLDPGEFIRHELSHATLNQHQTLVQAYHMRDAQPLFEGLAVSFGRVKLSRQIVGATLLWETSDGSRGTARCDHFDCGRGGVFQKT